MRPIKFKAVFEVGHKVKIMEVGSIVFNQDGTFIVNDEFPSEELIVNGIRQKLTLIEYTGLKDKNGKEIYEGDILKWENPQGESCEYYIIEWHICGWSSVWTGGVGIGEYLEDTSDFEVIGNIYENKELLKKGEK